MRRRKSGDRFDAAAQDLPMLRRCEATAAAMRALSGCTELSLRPGRERPSLSGTQATLPAGMLEESHGGIAALRGEADSLALRHRHHDPALHRRLAPHGGQAREIIDALERIRGPFNVNGAAIEAGAAAVADEAHVAAALEHNEKWLAWTTAELEKLGLTVTPSVGNFVLIHFNKTPGKTATEADAFLTQRGLILRAVGGYGLPDALRMTIGTEEANRLVVAALADFLKA